MIIPFKFAYLILTLPFAALWVILYIFSKKTRHEQIFISSALAPFGAISELLYFRDYWQPESILPLWFGSLPLFVEDFLFCFSIAGIGAVIYEAVFHQKLIKNSLSISNTISLPTIIIFTVLAMYALFYLGLNSIFATSFGLLLAAILIIAQRKDLFINSVLSGMAVMIIMFTAYLILFNSIRNVEELVARGWKLYGTNLDIRIFNIPATELIWGFSAGMFLGPLYEFWRNFKSRRNSDKQA